MSAYGQGLIVGIGWLIQFLLLFASAAAVLKALLSPRNRWRIYLKVWRLGDAPRWWIKLWRTDRESAALRERRAYLAGCGLRFAPDIYLAHRRCLLVVLPVLGMALYALGSGAGFAIWNVYIGLFFVYLFAAYDRVWLKSLRTYRTDRIRKEIVAVCSQLLYYTGSRLHLHGKLLKCLPLTRHIRSEMSFMLNEWYHEADHALQKFKERLGTDEAYGFAESLRSLRLNESDEIYDLLREIVREYKAKIELAKESRKETTSYLLFVLAGVPILYTFQIFLYPWVQEASKLFDALNP